MGIGSRSSNSISDDVTEIQHLVVDYIKQEAVAPLKQFGKKAAFGISGVFTVALGVFMLSLAILRALQVETSVFHGNWSWAPYLITMAATLILLGIIAMLGMAIGKSSRSSK